jgi:hypothetical protein
MANGSSSAQHESTFSLGFVLTGWGLAALFGFAALLHISGRPNVHDPGTLLPVLVAAAAHVASLTWLAVGIGVWRKTKRGHTNDETLVTKITIVVVAILNSMPYLMGLAEAYIHGG